MHPPTHQATWSSGLCDCFSDCSICCLTWWCPCVAFGRISEIVDMGSSSCGGNGALFCVLQWLTGCQWALSCGYRTKLRKQFNLQETPCVDCCVHYCCLPCALSQEYRELQHRGFDLAAGWEANVRKQNNGAPTVEVGMKR